MTALLSLAIMAWVILIGSLVGFEDPYSKTAYAFGVVTVAGPFVVADAVLVATRRRTSRAD